MLPKEKDLTGSFQVKQEGTLRAETLTGEVPRQKDLLQCGSQEWSDQLCPVSFSVSRTAVWLWWQVHAIGTRPPQKTGSSGAEAGA